MLQSSRFHTDLSSRSKRGVAVANNPDEVAPGNCTGMDRVPIGESVTLLRRHFQTFFSTALSQLQSDGVAAKSSPILSSSTR
jgi:hypothetical protein